MRLDQTRNGESDRKRTHSSLTLLGIASSENKDGTNPPASALSAILHLTILVGCSPSACWSCDTSSRHSSTDTYLARV